MDGMTKCRSEEEGDHTGFNSTDSHPQFDAFDGSAFGDGRATSVATTSNIRKTVHNRRFAAKELAMTRFHTDGAI